MRDMPQEQILLLEVTDTLLVMRENFIFQLIKSFKVISLGN
jgi:hypothetical protein